MMTNQRMKRGGGGQRTYIEEDKEDDEFHKQVQHSVPHMPAEERPAQKSQKLSRQRKPQVFVRERNDREMIIALPALCAVTTVS